MWQLIWNTDHFNKLSHPPFSNLKHLSCLFTQYSALYTFMPLFFYTSHSKYCSLSRHISPPVENYIPWVLNLHLSSVFQDFKLMAIVMFVIVAFIGEGSIAYVTLVRFFPCVTSHVNQHVGTSGKPFTTNTAVTTFSDATWRWWCGGIP